MSRTYSQRRSVEIDLTDAEGEFIGRTIPVEVEYLIDIDLNYGADADGRRGQKVVECELLDLSIAPEDLMTMTSDQVERALEAAKQKFHNGKI